jgi:hypothetical protein
MKFCLSEILTDVKLADINSLGHLVSKYDLIVFGKCDWFEFAQNHMSL